MKTAALLTLLAVPALAQPYIGGSVGYGETYDGHPSYSSRPHIIESQDTTSSTVGLFAGYRFGAFGLEVGAFTLPKYKGDASTDDYPAYKGLHAGTYPQTITLQQTIEGRSLYGRVNLYMPKFWSVTPYAFAGMARTATRNREWGLYNGVDPVDYSATYTSVRPLAGAGLQVSEGNTFARLEFLQVKRASDEYHIRRRDVRMVMLGVGWRF